MLDQMTFEKAEALKGTSFWAYPEEDHKVELRVEDVLKVMESQAARLKRAAFSVYLVGPSSYPIRQGTFPMTHDAFPEPFHLFIVPVAQSEDGFLYEAVFT